MKGRHVTWQKAVTQEDEIMKGRHVTLQKAVTFKGRFFVVTDFFPVDTDILTCSSNLTLRWRSVLL